MCGICGAVNKDSSKEISEQLIQQMSDALLHRGPDGKGVFVNKNVGLGHRRLSIIDVKGGAQPIFNENKTIGIVFNGEIYNYQDLRAELVEKGHIFSTASDTEAIVHAYEEYGPDCVKKFRGMFAFAIWDIKINRLMFARDRVGKKPLYYYNDENVFLFASEIKAILKTGYIKPKVHIPVLDFYLSLGYTPGHETLFENIHKLEPSQYLLLDNKFQLTIREYWDIADIPTSDISFTDACSKLKEILLESVKLRLISEVPLGAFLSGGLDSSIIVALMSRLSKAPVKTFSVGYKDDPDLSELKFAKTIASKFGTEHHEFFLTPDDLFSSIDSLLEHTEEPLLESAGIALYKLAKLAKPDATVLLSGEGSDEIFAGYTLYSKMQRMERMRIFLNMIPKSVTRRFLSLLADTEKNDKYTEWLLTPFKERYKSVSCDLAKKTRQRMYTTELKNELNSKMGDYFLSLHKRVSDRSMLRKMLYIDTKSWLSEDILVKSDRMTMAASVEMRCPFLDQELIEFATGLPDKYKLNGNIGKFILRESVKDMLPSSIINRRKMGFPVPLTSWFRGELHDRAQKLLLEERTTSRNYFNPGYIKALFKDIEKYDLGKRIFSLVILELWHRKYID